MIISIECSTNILTLALLKNDLIISHEKFDMKNELAQQIIPTIKSLLYKNSIKTHHLSHVVAGCGPGSFTGIRTVIAAAKGIVFSNKKLQSIGVNGLAGLAMSVLDEALKNDIKYIISLIDTKRDDVFLQLFQLNSNDKLLFPLYAVNNIEVLKIEYINEYLVKHNLIDKKILVVGHEARSINRNIVNLKISKNLSQYPKAAYIGKLASYLINRFSKIDNKDIVFNKFDPIYIRSPEINKKK